MTLEMVKELDDENLTQLVVQERQELNAKAEQRKQDNLAKIKELADAVGISITINGQRGRFTKNKGSWRIVKWSK